jgi:hypothetical protein
VAGFGLADCHERYGHDQARCGEPVVVCVGWIGPPDATGVQITNEWLIFSVGVSVRRLYTHIFTVDSTGISTYFIGVKYG